MSEPTDVVSTVEQLAAAVVSEGRLDVLGVVDVLHVEIDAEGPLVEDEVFVDAQVELVKRGQARGAKRSVLRGEKSSTSQ